ncbi:hypothetical protein PIIN_10863, partial [Serendipita indica DSM 11827]
SKILRLSLSRCGPIYSLSVNWSTQASKDDIGQPLRLFIRRNAPVNRWKRLKVAFQRVFPSHVPEEDVIGEFTSLEMLVTHCAYPHFHLYHIERTQDLEMLKMVEVGLESLSHGELKKALPHSPMRRAVSSSSVSSSRITGNQILLNIAGALRYPLVTHLGISVVGSYTGS